MPTLLKNIQINEISLVKDGANGEMFIAKSADGTLRLLAQIKKTDAAKQIAVGIVYQPDTPDTDNEMASAEEIEKAAWGALKNHAIVKTDHADPAPAYLAESYIVKAKDPDGFPEGGWAVVVKIEDKTLWEEIEKGEFKAFSMGGKAEKEPVEKDGEATPVEKEVYADASVFATGLKDALSLLQSIAASMGDVVKELGEVTKAGNADHESVDKTVEEVKKAVSDIGETVKKIAEKTTDGRVTSPAPGTPGLDPAKY